MNPIRLRYFFVPVLLFCLFLSISVAQRPELRRNSDLVRDVQLALAEKGYDPGPADGIMGPLTRSAIEAFQKASGLEVDGQLGDATLTALGVPIPAKDEKDGQGRGAVGAVGHAGATAGRAVGSAGETAAKATASGATTAGKATAKGATTAGKATAKGATVAGKSTAEGATTAGKATAKGATTAADATATGAKAVGSGVGKAASGTRDFLFGGNELKKEVERQLEQRASIDLDDLDVKVDDGVVTLRFKRGTREQWDRAMRIARSVEGVKDVVLITP